MLCVPLAAGGLLSPLSGSSHRLGRKGYRAQLLISSMNWGHLVIQQTFYCHPSLICVPVPQKEVHGMGQMLRWVTTLILVLL